MKKLLMICLMAGYGQCFAQNIDLRDLQRILEAATVDQINQLLGPKGYSLPRASSALRWDFRSDINPDASIVAGIYRVTDTAGTKLIYETTNGFFYTNLTNQLPGNGFQFNQAITGNDNATLVFSNGKHEILLNVGLETGHYRITLQPGNSLKTSLPRQYNHKARFNSY
jgi:hypothetical protein